MQQLRPNWSEWLNLLTRWFHIFAAILWVGSTYYFTWLDGRFQEEERGAKEAGGEGFYTEVVVSFVVRDAAAHYHVPLLLSPYGYSTYRGS